VTTRKLKPSGAPKKSETSMPRRPSKANVSAPQTTPKDNTASRLDAPELRQLEGVQGRVTELETALQGERQRVQDLQTKMAYLQAEFQNSMKALERKQSQFVEQANRDLVLRLLPVLDDLERASIMVPAVPENQPFIEGLAMVLQGFRAALESAGVKSIECKGQTFDPLRHEAVAREETTQYSPNTVMEELRKGYLLRGSLLRPSLVRVAVQPVAAPKQRVSSTAPNPQVEEPVREQPATKERKRPRSN
jgi:molecular chaperone GrpE